MGRSPCRPDRPPDLTGDQSFELRASIPRPKWIQRCYLAATRDRIFSNRISQIPLTRIRSATVRHGLPSMIRRTITAPIPGKASSSAAVAVLTLIRPVGFGSAPRMTRAFERTEGGKAMAVRFATIDSTIALLFAFFINAAILIVSAATFHGTEHSNVADISDAYQLLTPVLGVNSEIASEFSD